MGRHSRSLADYMAEDARGQASIAEFSLNEMACHMSCLAFGFARSIITALVWYWCPSHVTFSILRGAVQFKLSLLLGLAIFLP